MLAVVHPGVRPERYAEKEAMTARLVEMFEMRGIQTQDLTGKLRKEADPEALYLYNDEHFNAAGNQWMVRRIAEALRVRDAENGEPE